MAAADGLPLSGNAEDGPAGARDTIAADVEDLYGGEGPDVLTGNASENLIDAAGGDDRVDVRDASADAVFCGTGTDAVLVDADDGTDADCESARLPPPSAPVPSPTAAASPTPTPPPAPTVTPTPAADRTGPEVTLRVARKQRLSHALTRGLALEVVCSEACTVTGRLRPGARAAKALGLSRIRRPVTVAEGAGARVGRLVLRFRRAARRRLADEDRVQLRLVVTATDAARNTSTARGTVTLGRRSRLEREFFDAHRRDDAALADMPGPARQAWALFWRTYNRMRRSGFAERAEREPEVP